MKKEILLMVTILMTAMSFGQGFYEVKVNGNAMHSSNAYCSYYEIKAVFTNNDERIIDQGSFAEDVTLNINASIRVSNQYKVKEVRFYARRHHKRNCRTPSKHQGGKTVFVRFPYDCLYSTRADHGSDLFGDGLWSSNLTVQVNPLVEVLSPGIDDFLPLDHRVDLNATTGFPERLSTYTWQYSLDSGRNYQDFPAAFNGRSTISASAREILGTNAASHLGKKIQFRIKSCGTRRYSQFPRTYTIVPSAPTFVNKVEQITSCYESGNGSVRFTFSRPLIPGEKLAILPQTGSATFTSSGDLSELQTNPNTGVKDSYTIENLSPGNYEATVLGFYGRFNTYTLDPAHSSTFTIGRPTVVEYDVTEFINSRCNDGDLDENNNNDGEILITAKGGALGVYQFSYRIVGETFSNWQNFSSATEHRIIDLKPADYEIKVKKKVRNGTEDCIAYVLNASQVPTSVVKIVPITITEPTEPLQIEYTLLNEPRAFGFEDGRISARVFGGTAQSDGTYKFKWRNESGQELNTINAEVLPGNQGYQLILHSVGAGKYYLDVWDDKYDDAKYKTGCFEINSEFTLDQPDPLEVKIEILNEVSCNRLNQYNDGRDFNDPLGVFDQFQDGALIAYAKGGVAYDIANPDFSQDFPVNANGDLLPYYFSWKKFVGGVWIDLGINNDVIENVSEGTFALNIEDKNGIVLGTYLPISTPDGQEYVLDEAIDVEKYLPQPDVLEVSFTKTVISCAEGNDAMATAFVKGGTAPYTYRWSNGAKDTPSIENLFAGTYILYVEDAKGCQLEGSVVIEQPNGLVIDPEVKFPTCFEGSDGVIEVTITGGVKPYEYKWNTGSTSNKISGLTKGNYIIEITDSKKCKAFKEIVLEDPDPIIVDMEEKRSLCADQTLNLDIAIDDPSATYSWSSDNGFTSTDSAIEIVKAGRYTATITSGLGCIGIGDIVVEVFDTAIDADFLITTQAYTGEDIILVNVSEPMGERIEWTIPEGIDVVSKSNEELILRFAEEGAYDINLRSYQMDCYEDYTKTILVQPAIEAPELNTTQGEFIEEFIIYPNPSEGTFKTKIALAENSNIKVKIIDLMSGKTVHEREETNSLDFLLDYSMSMSTGVYLMLLETPNGSSKTLKLVFE
ncbi:T9SS type A sorting domain-containing protein [Aquimarina sp. 2304DJ70-9]|uniref:T9SS type A sorting domain-containing protein n=1 Tax=Aquimarina penaris TaxID=3231044 RepID=UPI003462E465